jgi:hypothetical protein
MRARRRINMGTERTAGQDGDPVVDLDPVERDDDSGDTSDVVEGPVGSASLKQPDEAAESSADLDELPTIDA